MFYQSSVRNQRPKGLKFKHALQSALLLAVCIWLLHQIKHSHDKSKEFDEAVQKKLSSEHDSVILGRKGNAGYSERVGTVSTDGNLIGEDDKKADGGDGDDELDRSTEEKAEEESLQKGREDSQGSFTTPEKRREDDQKNPEAQYNKDLMNNEEDGHDVQVKDVDEGVGSGEDSEEHNERIHGVHGFDDENGIPPDGHELVVVDAIANEETSNENATSLDEETILSSDNYNIVAKNPDPIAEGFRNSSQINEQNSIEMPTTKNMVVESEAFRSQEANGTAEGIVSEDSNSFPPQQEKEEVTDSKILLPQSETEAMSQE
ncbi:PREDICTED: uncharacterized protein LOC104592070 isoform X2 [Nelumbo nucifera]|nr:PREDICTED: uncharacterized protein LOC104592070 isoform X2 [Nelumbo nucifera]